MKCVYFAFLLCIFKNYHKQLFVLRGLGFFHLDWNFQCPHLWSLFSKKKKFILFLMHKSKYLSSGYVIREKTVAGKMIVAWFALWYFQSFNIWQRHFFGLQSFLVKIWKFHRRVVCNCSAKLCNIWQRYLHCWFS